MFEALQLEAPGLGPLDLTLGEGEIVGVAGLMGSWRSRLLRVVMGARAATRGQMRREHPVGMAPAPARVKNVEAARPILTVRGADCNAGPADLMLRAGIRP